MVTCTFVLKEQENNLVLDKTDEAGLPFIEGLVLRWVNLLRI